LFLVWQKPKNKDGISILLSLDYLIVPSKIGFGISEGVSFFLDNVIQKSWLFYT